MPLLKLSFEDPLFAAAFHPTKPEFVLGFASGNVTAYTYDPENGTCSKTWSTKRHRSSCRCLHYSRDGTLVYSAGSDSVFKVASSATGKVTAKTKLNAPANALCLNESFVAIGDDEGQLSVFEQTSLNLLHEVQVVENGSIDVLYALENKNKNTFVCAGRGVVSVVDARKNKVQPSDNQEEEVLSGCVCSNQLSVFGLGDGVLTVWRNAGLDDQQNRIRLSKDHGIESVLACEEDDVVVAGTGDGSVYKVDVHASRKSLLYQHGDEVSIMDYDFEYRLCTMSMGSLILWHKDEVQESEPARKKRKGKGKPKVEKESELMFEGL